MQINKHFKARLAIILSFWNLNETARNAVARLLEVEGIDETPLFLDYQNMSISNTRTSSLDLLLKCNVIYGFI